MEEVAVTGATEATEVQATVQGEVSTTALPAQVGGIVGPISFHLSNQFM